MAPRAVVNAREAIAATLHKLLYALDRNDLATFLSTFVDQSATGESTTHLPNLSAITTRVFNTIGPMDTTHQIGNMDVDIDEGESSEEGRGPSLSCNVWAMHKRKGEERDPRAEKYATGAEYPVGFVQGKEGWKVGMFEVEVV